MPDFSNNLHYLNLSKGLVNSILPSSIMLINKQASSLIVSKENECNEKVGLETPLTLETQSRQTSKGIGIA